MSVYIQRPDGSCLYFDLTDEEKFSGSAAVTKFPVESGSDITDNVRPQPTPFTCRCTISNTPLLPSGNQPGTGPGAFSDKGLFDSTVTINTTPYPTPPGTVALQVLLNPVGSVISAVGSLGSPTSVELPVMMFDEDFDANQDTLTVLEEIRQASELLTIFTSLNSYESMVLSRYEIVRNKDTGTGSDVELSFEPIEFVTTTSAPTPDLTKAAQTAKTSKGPQGPVAAQPPKSSVAKSGLNATGLSDAGSGVVQ
jgi:hypothetical protein